MAKTAPGAKIAQRLITSSATDSPPISIPIGAHTRAARRQRRAAYAEIPSGVVESQPSNRLMDVAMMEVAGVVLVLVYVIRGNTLRAISLRRASKAERRLYDEAQQD